MKDCDNIYNTYKVNNSNINNFYNLFFSKSSNNGQKK